MLTCAWGQHTLTQCAVKRSRCQWCSTERHPSFVALMMLACVGSRASNMQSAYGVTVLQMIRCHHAQAEVHTIFLQAEGILPHLLYSDGACVRLGGHSFHVLNIISAAGSITEARSRQAYARIALLPIVSRKHLGLPKKLSSADQEMCALCHISHLLHHAWQSALCTS